MQLSTQDRTRLMVGTSVPSLVTPWISQCSAIARLQQQEGW